MAPGPLDGELLLKDIACSWLFPRISPLFYPYPAFPSNKHVVVCCMLWESVLVCGDSETDPNKIPGIFQKNTCSVYSKGSKYM